MPKKQRKIVVLGGALSGPTAAARARETDPDASIVLLERAAAISYAVGGLPYYLSREVDAQADLAPYRAEFFARYYEVDVRTGVSVERFDADTHEVHTSAGIVRYDSLIYALGAGSIHPPQFGEGASNLSCLRTMADLERIDAILNRGAKRAVVVGGGFYGVEAADCLARRGVAVTLLERAAKLLPEFSPAAASRAARALIDQGVDVRTNVVIEGVQRKAERITAIDVRGASLPVDLILITAGVEPRSQIFAGAGGRVQRDGSIRVDKRCATNLADVYATSICVSHTHAVTGKPVWTTQAADADKTAQVAGSNAAGGSATLMPTLDTAILRAGALHLARTGSTDLSQHPRAARIQVGGHSCDPFFRGSAPLDVTLFYDRESERLLGAEVVGQAGVDKRIDVLATAIAGKLDLGRLAQLDLAYSPPYSTTRDLVNSAGVIGLQAQQVHAWTLDEFRDRLVSTLVFDVRTPAQREADPLPGARAIDLAELREHRKILAKAKQVVFVSGHGREGYLAARKAAHLGCPDAGYLSGGMLAWREAGNEDRS
ncbi:FAD-dependent oxidoreductase [Nannocystaceae bacterium ST9]